MNEWVNKGDREYQIKFYECKHRQNRKWWWCGKPGPGETRLQRRREMRGKGFRKHEHICFWLMNNLVISWTLDHICMADLQNFWVCKKRPLSTDIFRWKWRGNGPIIKTFKWNLSVRPNNQSALSPPLHNMGLWQHVAYSNSKGKNVCVIITKMKTMEIIRSIWIQNASEYKSCYLNWNVALLQILVKILNYMNNE